MMTKNKHWLYLEQLRRSGVVNMYGATPYLRAEFGLTEHEAREVLLDWMKNYKREDYVRICDVCGKPMREGYFILGTYYCSDECLHKDYTDEEYNKMYEETDEAYWTEWEEE